MDKETFINVVENSESKGLNIEKVKKLIIYISGGVLILILLFILIALVPKNNAQKKIIVENMDINEIIEGSEDSNDLIKENGYYYYFEPELDMSKILRFYKSSNKVIGASISVQKSEKRFIDFFPSGNWFNENYEKSAKYVISGNKISFLLQNVHYKGTLLDGDKIELFSHSDINGYEATRVFKFISLDVLTDIRNLDSK